MRVEVITYDPLYAPDFARLNYEWIERFFAVEEEDRLALEHPQQYAIAKGGEIFFVLVDGQAVGTVAMVPWQSEVGVFELAKMAVQPDQQGRGYGDLLIERCKSFARDKGAREIMLVTNDVLSPALGLYRKHGFAPVANYSDARYQRGNLQMSLQLRVEA